MFWNTGFFAGWKGTLEIPLSSHVISQMWKLRAGDLDKTAMGQQTSTLGLSHTFLNTQSRPNCFFRCNKTKLNPSQASEPTLSLQISLTPSFTALASYEPPNPGGFCVLDNLSTSELFYEMSAIPASRCGN